MALSRTTPRTTSQDLLQTATQPTANRLLQALPAAAPTPAADSAKTRQLRTATSPTTAEAAARVPPTKALLVLREIATKTPLHRDPATTVMLPLTRRKVLRKRWSAGRELPPGGRPTIPSAK